MAALITGLAVLFGRLRHEPWWAIGAAAIGANAFLTGIRWAGSLGDEASSAAFLAAGGVAVWAEVAAWARGRSAIARAEAPT